MAAPALTIGRFRFGLWATLFTALALALLIGLGNWQVRRLHWKTALIAARTAALAAPIVPVPEDAAAASALEFHHVSAHGRFENDRELYVAAEDRAGRQGYDVVTPLALDDGRDLLVNRGWVPEALKSPATRAAAEPPGPVEIVGILRIPPHTRGWLVPVNRPDENFWFTVDPAVMAEAAHLPHDKVLPFYIEANDAPNPGGWPLGGQTRSDLPNDHLQYAVTWYAFAVTLLVIFLVYHYRRAPP